MSTGAVKRAGWFPVGGSLLLALVLWGWAFRFGDWGALQADMSEGRFGLRLVLAWGGLALLGWLLMGPDRGRLFFFERRHPWLGVLSAILLYGLVGLGRTALEALLPDPALWEGVALVLEPGGKGKTHSPLSLLLLLVAIAPAEEIYWRGYLQRALVRGIGPVSGLFLGAGCYALAALWLGLPAALAAYLVGLVWGWIFLMERSLVPVMLSHGLWSLLILLTL